MSTITIQLLCLFLILVGCGYAQQNKHTLLTQTLGASCDAGDSINLSISSDECVQLPSTFTNIFEQVKILNSTHMGYCFFSDSNCQDRVGSCGIALFGTCQDAGLTADQSNLGTRLFLTSYWAPHKKVSREFTDFVPRLSADSNCGGGQEVPMSIGDCVPLPVSVTNAAFYAGISYASDAIVVFYLYTDQICNGDSSATVATYGTCTQLNAGDHPDPLYILFPGAQTTVEPLPTYEPETTPEHTTEQISTTSIPSSTTNQGTTTQLPTSTQNKQPSTLEPTSTQQPSTQQPSTQQPSTQQPSTQQSSTQQPSTQQPSTQQPNSTAQQTTAVANATNGSGGSASTGGGAAAVAVTITIVLTVEIENVTRINMISLKAAFASLLNVSVSDIKIEFKPVKYIKRSTTNEYEMVVVTKLTTTVPVADVSSSIKSKIASQLQNSTSALKLAVAEAGGVFTSENVAVSTSIIGSTTSSTYIENHASHLSCLGYATLVLVMAQIANLVA